MTDVEHKTSNQLAQIRTDLATSRNRMAANRTLMAWVRTALALDSFGFTIYKVLQAFQESGGILRRDETPRNIGLFLTGLGTFAMVMGTIEYWQTLKDLHRGADFRFTRPSLVMAVAMSVMGVFLFLNIITKLF